MTPYFDSDASRARLLAVAQSWLRTPFIGHAAIKGAGVDCVHLAAEIYRECGVFDTYAFPPYTLNGSAFERDGVVVKWLDNNPLFARIEEGQQSLLTSAPTIGDLLTIKIRRVEFHVAILVEEGRFVHCWSRPVALATFRLYRNSITRVYRPLKAFHG